MNKLLYLFLMVVALDATTDISKLYKDNQKEIDRVYLEQKQKEVYTKIVKEGDQNTSYYMLEPIKLEEKPFEEQCVEIEDIVIVGATLISKQELDAIKKPYLENCQGIKDLNNLAKKISNIYIGMGYATSRAFLKMQDLSDGIVEISIIEGRVGKVIAKEVYTKNIYSDIEDSILNLRVLEDGIAQYSKLRSKKVSLNLLPSKKVGYSDVELVSENLSKQYYGSIAVNNSGSEQTGKYQLSSSLTYENLFDLNDQLQVSFNTTHRVFKKDRYSFGKSISYSIPYINSYFTFQASDFKYYQVVTDEFGDEIDSRGVTTNHALVYEYNLLNRKRESFRLGSSLNRSKSFNKLGDVTLDVQNYTVVSGDIFLKHTYNFDTSRYYSILKVQKALSLENSSDEISDAKSKPTYFLDLFYSGSTLSKYRGAYDMAMHAQYSSYNDNGKEQFSIGGPYSVRGFRGGGVSGYKGGYLRSNLTIKESLLNIPFSPYIGVDYGYMKREKDIEGGVISGYSIGVHINYKSSTLEIYYNRPLKHTQETKENRTNFIGVRVNYVY
jgi:hemolysin activation/secretion protein